MNFWYVIRVYTGDPSPVVDVAWAMGADREDAVINSRVLEGLPAGWDRNLVTVIAVNVGKVKVREEE